MEKLKFSRKLLTIALIFGLICFLIALQKYFRYNEVKKATKNQEEAVKIIEPFIEKDSQNIAEDIEKPKEIIKQEVEPQIPASLNLDIAFTSQSPFAKWNARDEDACEEASLIMAGQYYKKINLTVENNIINPTEVDSELNKIIEWENANIREWKSTTILQTSLLAKNYFKFNVEIKDLSFSEIKKALVQEKLVILPAYGGALKNPFFKSPPPIYHMLLIKGWDGDKFITNDPGTKRGANYVYTKEILEKAVHDWNGGDVENGAQKMLIVWD